MDKNLNMAGYDLYEITKDEWILNVKNGPIYAGSFKKVVKQAVTMEGFNLDEITAAVSHMIEKDHNAAHFGMYRMFIFTFQKEFSNDGRKAS